jgi:acetyl-CoA acetyltransferase
VGVRPDRNGTVNGVELAGVGLHPFGRFRDRTATEMGVDATRAALADAGWARPADARGHIGAAFCATAYGGVAAGHRVLGALALTGIPIVDVEAGCASGGAALALAAATIGSGQHDAVLVVGLEKMPSGIIRSSFFAPWQEQAGLAATPAFFALRAQRLEREHGLGAAELAELVVKNRAWGAHNPDAMFRQAVTAEAVLASRLVCAPLHLWMLCSPNEGAAAVVLRRGEGGVQLRAAALRSHLPGSVLDESTPLAGIDDAAITAPSTLAAEDAYAEAGLGPDDLDVVECQDTDAARELLSWTELGLCAAGDQRRLLDADPPPGSSPGSDVDAAEPLASADPDVDALRRPKEGPAINRSGGLLSKGEPLGASGLGQVVELVRQLRGQAGARQVPDARIGLAHTIGRGANASVTIVSR